MGLIDETRSCDPRSPGMAITLTKLADLCGRLGEATRKCELLAQALEILQECLEAPCREIGYTLILLGGAHGEVGDTVQMCQFFKMSLTMVAKVCPLDSGKCDFVLRVYCEAYRRLTATNPTKSRELLEGTLQEGCLSSSDEFLAATLMLLAAAHNALGNKEKMCELYQTVVAKCKWEVSSMSIDEASTAARARGIFTTRRCADAEEFGQAIPWQGEEVVLAGLCPSGHSLCPGSAIGKRCDVCNLDCPRTAWSWECWHCNLDVCPACMAAFGPLVIERPHC
eukprot:1978604-Amphidinium_carterae.1